MAVNMARVQALLAAVQQELSGIPTTISAGGGGGGEDWRNETGFPKIRAVNGVRMLLKAPLNPSWVGSVSSNVFGGLDKEGVYLADPSNSDGTVPLRSPAGYPLIYGIDLGGAMSTRIPPRVSFGGNTMLNDAEVESFKVASADSAGKLLQNDADVNVPGKGFPIFDAAKTAALLVEFNNGIIGGRPDLSWYGITQAEMFALQNLGMTRHEINLKVSQYNTGAAQPADYHASSQKAFRDSGSPLFH